MPSWDDFPDAPQQGSGATPEAGTGLRRGVVWDDFPDAGPGEPPEPHEQPRPDYYTESTGDMAADAAAGIGYGTNVGIDATLNLIGAPIRAPVNWAARQFGYEGDLIPELKAARHLNVAGVPDTTAGRVGEAVGEVVGSGAAPTAGLAAAGVRAGQGAAGVLGQFARRPTAAAGVETGAATSAGVGVGAAREAETGPVGEFAAGLAAGFAGPGAVNIASRRIANVTDATNFARRQVDRSRDPQQAAYDDIADLMVSSGIGPEDIRSVVLPPLSASLRNRGWDERRLGEMVGRQLGGDPTEQLAREYGIGEDTVRNYVRAYQENNITPRNVVDVARQTAGEGRAKPIANTARRDMAIADDPEAAERLISRQVGQPGRTADIAEASAPSGRTYDEVLEEVTGEVRRQASRAYDTARQAAQPINLRPTIQTWRSRFPGGKDQGELSEKVNRAIDTFFRGSLVEGADQTMRQRRFADVVSDVPNFLARRQELDQQIARSYDGNRPTPLTRQLTQFRQDINRAARRSNPELARADALFSGARDAERLLEQGANVGRRMNARSREMVREFRNLSASQQEIYRLGFIQSIVEGAMNKRFGLSASRQFDTPAFAELVEAFFPRSAGRDVHRRGQQLLERLRSESAGSRTFSDIMSGSRTAPLQDDMAQMLEQSRTAAKLLTGDIRGLMEDWTTFLARRIGEGAARERIRILTETDPARLPQVLNRLADSAEGASERQFWRDRLRDYAKVNNRLLGNRPSALVGTTVGQTESQ